jgi:hypothetical protein
VAVTAEAEAESHKAVNSTGGGGACSGGGGMVDGEAGKTRHMLCLAAADGDDSGAEGTVAEEPAERQLFD